jgi:hypothetical protein
MSKTKGRGVFATEAFGKNKYLCQYVTDRDIEDITRRREDMTFIFEWCFKTIFYERAQRVSKILFLTREDKSHIFKPPCNVLFII